MEFPTPDLQQMLPFTPRSQARMYPDGISKSQLRLVHTGMKTNVDMKSLMSDDIFMLHFQNFISAHVNFAADYLLHIHHGLKYDLA